MFTGVEHTTTPTHFSEGCLHSTFENQVTYLLLLKILAYCFHWGADTGDIRREVPIPQPVGGVTGHLFVFCKHCD